MKLRKKKLILSLLCAGCMAAVGVYVGVKTMPIEGMTTLSTIGIMEWELRVNGTSVEEQLQGQIERYTQLLETATTKKEEEQIKGLIEETEELLEIYSAFKIF